MPYTKVRMLWKSYEKRQLRMLRREAAFRGIDLAQNPFQGGMAAGPPADAPRKPVGDWDDVVWEGNRWTPIKNGRRMPTLSTETHDEDGSLNEQAVNNLALLGFPVVIRKVDEKPN